MKKSIFWIITILVPFCVYAIAPTDVSPKFPMFMALTSAAVCAWATSILPATVVGGLLCFGYILTGTAGPRVVFAPALSVMPWLVFASVVINHAMEKTGLARRVALYCMRLSGGTFPGLILAFFVAGLIITFILPSMMARTVIFIALAAGIIDALEIDPRSRLSSAIIMLGYFAANSGALLFLHCSEGLIWAADTFFKDIQPPLNFWEYMRQGTLLAVVYFAMSVSMVFLIKGKEKFEAGSSVRRYVSENSVTLGAMSFKEKILLLLIILIVTGFMTESLTGLNPTYVFCLLTLVCFLPGVDILNESDLNKIQFGMFIFVVFCLAIGSVGGEVGAVKWGLQGFIPILDTVGSTVAPVGAYVFAILANFLVTPLAAMAAFVPTFAEIGNTLNLNPLPLFYGFAYGLEQVFFPYETVPFLYIFITGKVTLRHIVGPLGIRMVIGALLILLCSATYWRWIGLI